MKPATLLALAGVLGAASPAAADDDPFGLKRKPRPTDRPTTTPADDDPCRSPALGPVTTPLDDGGVARGRAGCIDDVGLVALRGLAAIDLPEFYGTLAGAVLAEARVTFPAGLELTVAARMVDYRFAQNAVATADEVGGGPITLGVARASRTRAFGRRLAVVHDLRLSVPATDATRDSADFTAVPAIHASLMLTPRLALHGQAAAVLWAAFPAAGVTSRGAASAALDAAVAMGPTAAALGLTSQLGFDGTFDHLAARAAFRLGRDSRLELASTVRLLGADRLDAAVELASWIAF